LVRLTINTVALQGKQGRLLREVYSVTGNNRGLCPEYSFEKTVSPVVGSENPAAADDAQQDGNDGDYQKDVDESPQRVGSDQPEQPQDDQDDGDGVEHGMTSLAGTALVCGGRGRTEKTFISLISSWGIETGIGRIARTVCAPANIAGISALSGEAVPRSGVRDPDYSWDLK
jgi:hypothetical protein